VAVLQKNSEKITISLSKKLAKQFKALVPPRQRSAFIAQLLEQQLALQQQLDALDESAGVWRDENHPDLATGGVDAWLESQRKNWQ